MGKKVKHVRNLSLANNAYDDALADPTYTVVELATAGRRKTKTSTPFDLVLTRSKYDYSKYYSAFELEVVKDDGAEVPTP